MKKKKSETEFSIYENVALCVEYEPETVQTKIDKRKWQKNSTGRNLAKQTSAVVILCKQKGTHPMETNDRDTNTHTFGECIYTQRWFKHKQMVDVDVHGLQNMNDNGRYIWSIMSRRQQRWRQRQHQPYNARVDDLTFLFVYGISMFVYLRDRRTVVRLCHTIQKHCVLVSGKNV